MTGRSYYKPRAEGTLKQAQAQLVGLLGGPGLAQARIKKTVLHQCTDDAHPDRHLPLDVVIDLERQAGQPVVTRYLAAAQHCLVVPLPPQDSEPYPLVLARVTTETGELLSAGGQSVRDGTVTKTEAHLLKRKAMELAAAVAALIADCDGVIDGEGRA